MFFFDNLQKMCIFAMSKVKDNANVSGCQILEIQINIIY